MNLVLHFFHCNIFAKHFHRIIVCNNFTCFSILKSNEIAGEFDVVQNISREFQRKTEDNFI